MRKHWKDYTLEEIDASDWPEGKKRAIRNRLKMFERIQMKQDRQIQKVREGDSHNPPE